MGHVFSGLLALRGFSTRTLAPDAGLTGGAADEPVAGKTYMTREITTSGDPNLEFFPNLEPNLFGNGLASNIFLLRAMYRFAF